MSFPPASEQISGLTDVLGARVFVTAGVHAVRVASAALRPAHLREKTIYFSSCLGVRGQCPGAASLLPPRGSWEPRLGHQLCALGAFIC